MGSTPTRQHISGESAKYQRCPETMKATYANYGEAHDFAEWMMEQGHVNRGCHITPYLCDHCAYWHVANKKVIFPVKFDS